MSSYHITNVILSHDNVSRHKRFEERGGPSNVILSHDNVAHPFGLVIQPWTPWYLSPRLNGFPGEPIELFWNQSAGRGGELPSNVGPETTGSELYFREVHKQSLKYGVTITSILSTPQWSKHNQGTRSIGCLVPPPDASSSPCVGSMSRGHGLQGWQRLPEVPLWTSRICAAGPQVVFHTA